MTAETNRNQSTNLRLAYVEEFWLKVTCASRHFVRLVTVSNICTPRNLPNKLLLKYGRQCKSTSRTNEKNSVCYLNTSIINSVTLYLIQNDAVLRALVIITYCDNSSQYKNQQVSTAEQMSNGLQYTHYLCYNSISTLKSKCTSIYIILVDMHKQTALKNTPIVVQWYHCINKTGDCFFLYIE